jgi:hypothetical protein
MFNPVSVGLVVPDPNSRFSDPVGLVVLLLTGSACHWKVCVTPALVPLLKAEAARSMGSEFAPLVAVATPALGRLSKPRIVLPPLTSSVAAGFVVLIPTFAVLPDPDWKITELMMSEVESHSGTKFNVPVPVTCTPAGGGAL